MRFRVIWTQANRFLKCGDHLLCVSPLPSQQSPQGVVAFSQIGLGAKPTTQLGNHDVHVGNRANRRRKVQGRLKLADPCFDLSSAQKEYAQVEVRRLDGGAERDGSLE